MRSILVFDPGESTGWVFRDSDGNLVGGVCGKDHKEIAERFYVLNPDLVVFERFNLYPGMAKTLSWNTFYPCEVIGVIRYLCDKLNISYVEQSPSVKKYFGGNQPDWEQLRNAKDYKFTEHEKDAYQHLKYFERNGERKLDAKKKV